MMKVNKGLGIETGLAIGVGIGLLIDNVVMGIGIGWRSALPCRWPSVRRMTERYAVGSTKGRAFSRKT